MRRGVRQHQGALDTSHEESRERKKLRDWRHTLDGKEMTPSPRSAHPKAEKGSYSTQTLVTHGTSSQPVESEKAPQGDTQIKSKLPFSMAANSSPPPPAPILETDGDIARVGSECPKTTSCQTSQAEPLAEALDEKPEMLPAIPKHDALSNLTDTESWSHSDSETRPSPPLVPIALTPSSHSSPSPLSSHALPPTAFPVTPLSSRLTPELRSSPVSSAFSPFSQSPSTSIPSFSRCQPPAAQLSTTAPPAQAQCLARRLAAELRAGADYFDSIAARSELTTQEGTACRVRLLEHLETLAAQARDDALKLRTALESKGVVLPPPKCSLAARKARGRPRVPKREGSKCPPAAVQPLHGSTARAVATPTPGAIPRAPRRKPVDVGAESGRARRPLKDASHLTRIRTSPHDYVPMRTVKEVGPVHLQVPVDPATLPQATQTLRGKIFEYQWQYEGVTAKKVVDTDGQHWVHVFAKTDTTIPSIVVAVQAVSAELLAALEAQSEPILRKLNASERDPLRYTQSVILGYWRPYRCLMAPSRPSLGLTERSWLKQQQPLFEHVSSLLQRSLPTVHERLRRQTERLFPPFKLGVYPTMALNQTVCTEHLDVQDLTDLRCGVLAFGKWKTGGALLMPELGVRLALQPGDVVFFPSALYLHENEPLQEGETRRSLVFFAHTDVISDNTQYPSAEDIAALADGREPSWKIEARRERELMKDNAAMAGAMGETASRHEARDCALTHVVAADEELAAGSIACLSSMT